MASPSEQKKQSFISSDTGDQEQQGCKRVMETELFLKGSSAIYHLVPR